MNMETRIGRIERYLEEFAKGMLALKESQKQTDAHIIELKEAQKKRMPSLIGPMPN